MYEQATLALTADLVRNVAQSEPLAVICGGDTGVKLTDACAKTSRRMRFGSFLI